MRKDKERESMEKRANKLQEKLNKLKGEQDDDEEPEEKTSSKNESHGKGGWIFAIIIGIVILAVIFGSISQSQNNSGSLPNPETKKSCSDVQVPYEDTETYIDQEPYQDTEYYDYYLNLQSMYAVNQEKLEIVGRGYYRQAQIGIKNLDTESGWVNVIVNWKTLSRQWTDNVRHFISPDQTVEFISEFDVDSGEDNTFTYTYTSDPIQKSRIVTKYRDVTKTRTVTKYRTEQQCS